METTPEPTSELYDYAHDPDGLTRGDFDRSDVLLDLLLRTLLGDEDTDANFAVTVSVHGTLITGSAVSFATWARLFTDTVAQANQAAGETVAAVTAALIQGRSDFVVRRNEGELPIPSPLYLHLKEAVTLRGLAVRPTGLVRVNKTSIDAWAFGKVDTSA